VPTRESAVIGAPCWVDLMTSDSAASRTFYTELFGWDAEEPNPEFGGYFSFTKDGVRIAGCMSSQDDPERPDAWSIYLATEDAAKTLELATSHQGRIIVDAMPVGDLGIMAFVADPGGASIGLWQPGEHQGFLTLGEPGTPGWFELHTRDYAKVVDFYRDVFGLETEVAGDTPEFRYTVQKRGEEQYAGVMDATNFLPEGLPAHWSVYFAVADADASLAKIEALGGSVVLPAEDHAVRAAGRRCRPDGRAIQARRRHHQRPEQLTRVTGRRLRRSDVRGLEHALGACTRSPTTAICWWARVGDPALTRTASASLRTTTARSTCCPVASPSTSRRS